MVVIILFNKASIFCGFSFLLFSYFGAWSSRPMRGNSEGMKFVGDDCISNNVNILERLVRLCLDDTRHILYSLSENGSIQVYDLRADGNSIVKVASLSHGQIQVQFS